MPRQALPCLGLTCFLVFAENVRRIEIDLDEQVLGLPAPATLTAHPQTIPAVLECLAYVNVLVSGEGLPWGREYVQGHWVS